MGERVVVERFSDISGQQVEDPTDLVRVVVDHHPNLDHAVVLEAQLDELDTLAKHAIAAVGLEVIRPGDEESAHYILSLKNFNSLATHRPMEEVLADAQPALRPKQPRRSHNTTVDGQPLRSYNSPEWAGMPHKGKIGDEEAAFVRDNLQLVNERRQASGHAPIDPSSETDAKRYGFAGSETAAGESRVRPSDA